MKYNQTFLYPEDNYSGYEQATVILFRNLIKSDWTVFDCGAKTGYFTLLFSEICETGLVHAFEPTSTYDMLVSNVNAYNITNVVANKLALGDKVGNIEDSIFRIWGLPAEKMVYEFTTIDEYCKKNNINRLDLIKVDVDSYDFDLLKGSVNTLKTLKPIITVELNYALSYRGSSKDEVISFLEQNEYVLSQITNDENHTFIHKEKI